MNFDVSAEEFRPILESVISAENERLRTEDPQSPVFQIINGIRRINIPDEGTLMFKSEGGLVAPSRSLFQLRQSYQKWLDEYDCNHSTFWVRHFLDDFFQSVENDPSFSKPMMEQVETDSIFDAEKALQTIVPCICKTSRNQEILEEIPHRELHDLSIYYRIRIELPEGMDASGAVVVNNRMLDTWNHHSDVPITEETLFERAYTNEKSVSRIMGIYDVMQEMLGLFKADESPYTVPEAEYGNMYTVSNRSRQYGAADAFLGIGMEELAGQKEMDFYILPSSVHEAILVPVSDKGELQPEELAEIVSTVNGSEVDEEDKLSDSVYFYDHRTKSIQIVFDPEADTLEKSAPEKDEQEPVANHSTPRRGR